MSSGRSAHRVLVVGATGNLGTRVVRRLAAAGVRPSALVRSREKGTSIEAFAKPVLGDLTVPSSLVAPFREAERVLIVAPPVPEMETIERNAMEAAVSAGARHIVYLSNFAAREGSELKPVHTHGAHEKLVASLGVDWTVLGPTRYMTSLPFSWRSVLEDGVLLEAGGAGVMTCIDPDDVAEVAVKCLTEPGHAGEVYRLTSEDELTAASLAALLSSFLRREIVPLAGNPATAPMAGYFRMVSAGVYRTTDTAARLLGRPASRFADWLRKNPPAGA